MSVEGLVKQESSLPVQSRVDIRTLANLLIYWETSSASIRNMSQLLSWSLEMFQQVLITNGKLPEVIESVARANEVLIERGLYQPGLRKRGKEKLLNAIRFENLRIEGEDPEQYVPQHYNKIHNPHSVRQIYEMKEELRKIKERKEHSRRLIEEAKLKDKERQQVEYDENGVVIQETTRKGVCQKGVDKWDSNEEEQAPTKVRRKKKEDPRTHRPATKEELETILLERERKEKMQLEKLSADNMAVPKFV